VTTCRAGIPQRTYAQFRTFLTPSGAVDTAASVKGQWRSGYPGAAPGNPAIRPPSWPD